MTHIRGKIYILLALVACMFAALPCFSASASSKKPFVIVIDAGHGGKDVGAIDNGHREKDINLGVARELGEMLRKMKDVKVVFTRTDDTFKTLQERADIANKAKGNLFISIHTNSLDANNPRRSSVEGTSVYVLGLHKDDNNMKVARRENSVIRLEQDYGEKYEGFDPQKDESYIIFEMAQKKNLSYSIKFAEEAEKQLVKVAGRKSRGVHQAGFWVLWATSMPGALVELDFICNPQAADFIGSAKGQKKLAEALFKSIEQYRKELKLAESRPKKQIVTVADDSSVTLEAAKGSTKVKTQAPRLRASAGKATGRRRRNASSRRASENRDYETDFIAVNTHSAKSFTHGIVSEIETAPADVPTADVKSSGKGKKKNVKNKKERKVNPRKSKSSGGTRIVNGKEVSIGVNSASRVSAKESSSKARETSRARVSKKDAPKDDTHTASSASSATADQTVTAAAPQPSRDRRNDQISAKGKVRDNIASDNASAEMSKADTRVKKAFSSRAKKESVKIQNESASGFSDPENRINRASRNRRSGHSN